MTDQELDKLKYPIGKFSIPENFNDDIKNQLIDNISNLPLQLNELSKNITSEKLKLQYRPESWSVAQVIHHIADSHMNAFLRFKIALTEDHPTIKGYNQNKFVFTADADLKLVQSSLLIIEGIHQRWTELLTQMSMSDFERTFYHAEYEKEYILKNVLALYSWHGQHHLAHINNAIK